MFEGGTRVRAFINGKDLKPSVYEGMFHSVDLLPTLMSSALNIPIGMNFFEFLLNVKLFKLLFFKEFEGIDGVNQWDRINNNQESRRESFIYNIDPVGNLGCEEFTEAIRLEKFIYH